VLEIGQKVNVKVLDVDRDRQRISLGLKQTQTDPWQRVIDECQQGDVVAGRITKVVTFGAFAEIVSGVEGLIHISELAEHHVENPREVVQQGDAVNVKIIEIDPDRRRLSLSLRRVEPGEPVKTIDVSMPGSTVSSVPVPELGSDEVFGDTPDAEEAAPEVEPEQPGEPEEPAAAAPEAESAEAEAESAEAEAETGEPEPEAEPAEEAEPAATEE
jgi:small subunit ribosomal protein S1